MNNLHYIAAPAQNVKTLAPPSGHRHPFFTVKASIIISPRGITLDMRKCPLNESCETILIPNPFLSHFRIFASGNGTTLDPRLALTQKDPHASISRTRSPGLSGVPR